MFREESCERSEALDVRQIIQLIKKLNLPPISPHSTSDFCNLTPRIERGEKSFCASSKSVIERDGYRPYHQYHAGIPLVDTHSMGLFICCSDHGDVQSPLNKVL